MSINSQLQPDGLTILQTLDRFEGAGYVGQFAATESGIRCFTCETTSAANTIDVSALERVEGTSDPDDMAAVLAVQCRVCKTKGTLTLKYGAETSPEEEQALILLPRPRRR